MAKFKCVASGNIIEFTSQVDIDSMKGHSGYIRVDEVPVDATAANEAEAHVLPFKAPVPTKGRPKKAA
jgi:hypothetical protein